MPQTHHHTRPKSSAAAASPEQSSQASTSAPTASSDKTQKPTQGPEEKIDRVDPKFAKPLRSEEPEGLSAEEANKQNGFSLEDRLTLAFLTVGLLCSSLHMSKC